MDGTDKAKWISAKIKRILAEGINGKKVSNDVAVAVAERMWQEMSRKSARMAKVSQEPWGNFSESDYDLEQMLSAVPSAIAAWAREQAKKENREVIKADLKLRFKEPDGEININGVRAALQRLPQVQGLPADVLSKAKDQLSGILDKYNADTKLAKVIRMPILPASPTKTIDGRELTEGHISAVLAYDVTKRPAVVKLDQVSAHGDGNGPVYGTIQRTYQEGTLIYADVTPSRGYEGALADLCSADGPFPFRSIECDNLIIDGQKRPWLESVALVGAQKAAIQNLPPVEFSAEAASKVQFTIDLTGGESMSAETKPDAEKVDLAKLKSDMEADFAKQREADKAEFAKQIAEEKAARLAIEADLERQRMKEFFASKLSRKVATTEVDDLINLALSLPDGEGKIAFAKAEITPRQAFLKSLENRKDVAPELKVVAGHVTGQGEEILPDDPVERGKVALAKIRAYGKENNIDTNTIPGFEQAERELRLSKPELFEGVR